MNNITNNTVFSFGWREICRCCGQISPLGFWVPDEVWQLSIPNIWSQDTLRERPVCIICFARFADEAGVEWDKEIKFFPVSLVTHQSRSQERLQELQEDLLSQSFTILVEESAYLNRHPELVDEISEQLNTKANNNKNNENDDALNVTECSLSHSKQYGTHGVTGFIIAQRKLIIEHITSLAPINANQIHPELSGQFIIIQNITEIGDNSILEPGESKAFITNITEILFKNKEFKSLRFRIN